ncbi:uncharacterized protein LOC111055007 [Nilaparvata lugens]|uniref:uncharacterized protein LOC111055007 n=1 Tax=Nilaparvata lugens TaxID=108931 RepID=UPI00193D22EF|nr:uncharacterized protein LOC111055007 [Nilaparvata lugens]
MSIRVTVNSNQSSDCSRRFLKDVETEKRNEWNRRRLLRIQQVRQQSKDFANSLREKIHGECDLQKENNNKQWQEKTLDRLTDKYRDCLKDIGLAHAKAARQPDPDEILREERIRNAVITGIRGESAMCLLKCRREMKKLEETVPTRLKAYVRAKEDLRSTMVASLPQPQPKQKKSPVKKKISPVKRRVVASKQKRPRQVLREIPSNLPEDYVTVIERIPDDAKVDKCCGSATVVNDDEDRRDRPQSPKFKCHCSPKKSKAQDRPETTTAKTSQENKKKKNRSLVPGTLLGRRQWCCLNRFRTSTGRCAQSLALWGFTPDPYCECGEIQTMEHLVSNCPLFPCEGGLQEVHAASDMGCATETRRQRRYSDTCHVSDVEDSCYDSDTTWPPRSRRSSSSSSGHVHGPVVTSSHVPAVTSSHVQCYDHGNRHHSSRPANSVTSSYVKRIDEEVQRRTALEEDMRKKQCCEAMCREVVCREAVCREARMKQQAKRGEDALRRQQRRNDFDKFMQELKSCATETRRQRRYSDTCHVSDVEDSCYDSDTTWPPRSRRSSSSSSGHMHGPVVTSSHVPAVTSSHVQCYDHGNRHHSSRPANSVTSSYVKRIDEEVQRRTALEEDMRAKQCCEAMCREAVCREAVCREARMKQQAKRGEDALRRQQRRNDFDKFMQELSKLNREERKLRYTNWTKNSTDLGDTQRKMATKIRQKKMESAFEMEFMEPIKDEKRKEAAVTPKLNVADWKKSECVETLEISSAKQNDKLTLSNLMKRINEQREMLFQEIRTDTNDRERGLSNDGGSGKLDRNVQDRTDYSNRCVPSTTTSNIQSGGAKYNPNDFTDKNGRTSRNSEQVEDRESTQQTQLGTEGRSSKLQTVYGFEDVKLPRKRDGNDEHNRDSSTQQTQIGSEGRDSKLQTVYGFENVKLPRQQQTRDRNDTSSKGSSRSNEPTDTGNRSGLSQMPQGSTRYGSNEATNTGNRSGLSQMPCKQTGPCFCGSTVETFCRCSDKIGENTDERKEESRMTTRVMEPPISRVEDMCCCCGNSRKQCVCSKSSDTISEKSANVPPSNDYRRTNRLRLPSPIPEVSETSYKQESSREADDNDAAKECSGAKVDKTVEKRNIGEATDKKGGKVDGNEDKNSDSSLSTLYSLDMALSQVPVEKNDEKDDGSSTNAKALRITVKVTGGKEFKEKTKKKKSKTEEEKLLKECKKLLEDKGNVRKRNFSGDTSSTSYRSPPEHLSPKQLQLLRDILKQIDTKSDQKGMPLLKQYILRLLSMKRESIDCLGVSSSDVSLQSSLVREMVGNLGDSRNLDEDVTLKYTSCEEKGVQVSLVDSSSKNDNRREKKSKVEGARERIHKKGDEDVYEDPSGSNVRKQRMSKNRVTQDSGFYQGVTADDGSMLDDLDVLTQQINTYFETKQNDKSDEIVKKYMELAKRYTDRISNLADLIGDVETDLPSSLIRSRSDEDSNPPSPEESSHSGVYSPIGSQNYNETSYMSLPPELNVPLPTRRLEPLDRISPTFDEDKLRQDISWHEALSHPLPTRISPSPDESKWFRPKPPPTMLNNHLDPDLRTSSPHELSTIHEVDTPSTSWRRDLSQQLVTSSPRKRSSSGYRMPPDESIPLDNNPKPDTGEQRISDQSFQTLRSSDDDSVNLEEKGIMDESMPDVMQELIRRNIMTSPYEWLKEMQERGNQDTADEEVRRIMRESPEDLEAALKNLGIGWASTTLRKTRQAGELSGDSSSPPDGREVGAGAIETSTPRSSKPTAWPAVGSETEISAIRLIASSSSELALTPPDISLKPPQLSLSSNSSNSDTKTK